MEEHSKKQKVKTHKANNPKKSKWFASVLLTIFITIIGIVCLTGLVGSIYTFISNQQAFNKAYVDAAALIANLPPEEKAAAQISIDHLERLQQIQQNSASSRLKAFKTKLIFGTI